MSGLFRRARALRTRMDLLGELKNDDFVLEIPDEEKNNVLSGIDSMLKDERIRMDEGALRFIPKKRSFVLPLMLNVGAVLILGVGALVMWQFFNRSETALAKPDVGITSAEGRILDRLRQDAEAKLGAKEREISDIRNLLASLENQRSQLTDETEAKFIEREAQLRREFDNSLAAERARLTESGVSGENLTIALAAYESEVRNSLEADLAEARNAAEAEREQLVAELDALQSEYENRVVLANGERTRLQDELEARNAELDQLVEAGRAEGNEASRQLDDLRAIQEQEDNITAQILAFYSRVGTARSAGESEVAMTALDSLESYLGEDGIRGTGVVESRREIDTFLTGALRQLILLESTGVTSEPVLVTDPAAEATLAALAAGASAGTQLADDGNLVAAQEVWRDAFSAMPELEEAFVSAIGGFAAGALVAARDEGLAEGLETGRSESDTARQEGFDSGRNSALEESEVVISRLKGQIDTLGSRIAVIAQRYSRALSGNKLSESESREQLVNILDTKLELKDNLDQSLHDRLDEYTDTTGDLRELDGRSEVYAEILGFLTELSAAAEE